MKIEVPLWPGLLAAFVATGCASPPPLEQAAGTGQQAVRFACGNGETVEMQFYPEQRRGVLVRSGWTVDLPQQPVAAGFAYSNGPTTVRGQGNELTIQIAHLAPVWCRSRSSFMVAGHKAS